MHTHPKTDHQNYIRSKWWSQNETQALKHQIINQIIKFSRKLHIICIGFPQNWRLVKMKWGFCLRSISFKILAWLFISCIILKNFPEPIFKNESHYLYDNVWITYLSIRRTKSFGERLLHSLISTLICSRYT